MLVEHESYQLGTFYHLVTEFYPEFDLEQLPAVQAVLQVLHPLSEPLLNDARLAITGSAVKKYWHGIPPGWDTPRHLAAEFIPQATAKTKPVLEAIARGGRNDLDIRVQLLPEVSIIELYQQLELLQQQFPTLQLQAKQFGNASFVVVHFPGGFHIDIGFLSQANARTNCRASYFFRLVKFFRCCT